MKLWIGLIMFAIVLSGALTGCATVSSSQKMDIAEWKADGVYVEEKSPSLAAGLNCVLGAGDFYNGNVGYGIANLLTWPLSIFWAPVGGYDGALAKNWEETQMHVKRADKKEAKKNVVQ